MILLDTNIISEFMRPIPEPRVVSWLDRQPRSSVWTTSITVLEIQVGIQTLAHGKRREQMAQAFKLILSQKLERRVAVFDSAAAEQTAALMAGRIAAGRPGELRDSMIAGIALAANANLATRNIRHFEDLRIRLINPWVHN
jgi:toxin FitB